MVHNVLRNIESLLNISLTIAWKSCMLQENMNHMNSIFQRIPTSIFSGFHILNLFILQTLDKQLLPKGEFMLSALAMLLDSQVIENVYIG